MAQLKPLPRDVDNAVVAIDGREVRLTNLRKVFWRELKFTKGSYKRSSSSDVLIPNSDW